MALASRHRTALFISTLAAAIVIVVLSVYWSQQKISRTVQIGIVTWPGFAVGFVGAEKKLFGSVDVRLKVIDDIAARHAAFRSGDVDIMISSVDGFAQEYAQGIRGKIILVTDESFGGDGLVVGPSINSAVDLKGKRVAFARATPSHFLLYKVLQQAGLKPSDIVQIQVDDASNAGQAFLGGSVDAAVTWEPLLSEVTKSGKGRVLATSRDFPGTIIDILIASPKLLERTETVRGVIAGWLASVSYVLQHPDESLPIIAKGLNMPVQDAAGVMKGLRLADRAKNQELLCGADPSKLPVARIADEASAFWKEQKVISDTPSSVELISNELCQLLQPN